MILKRAILADDHELLLDGLRRLLEPEIEVVGSVADGHALVEMVEQLKPDLVVEIPQAYTLPAAGKDVYRNFVFPMATREHNRQATESQSKLLELCFHLFEVKIQIAQFFEVAF